MDKEKLIKLLLEGKTHREIAKILGMGKSNVGYWIDQYELKDLSAHKKPIYIDDLMFNKINTKEKAYIIGYALADAYISDETLEFGCMLSDKEILEFISKYTGANITYDMTYNKQSNRFPRARISIGNKNIVTDFNKHCSSKENKRIPIIPKELDRYLVQGFFDGNGCITWGYRKDRNRIWHKISFTAASLKVLEGLQQILLKRINISTIIRPKSNENCFVLEFSNKNDVLTFIKYIYPNGDFIKLNRKYKKAHALRLELGEFGEVQRTPSEATKSLVVERVETNS